MKTKAVFLDRDGIINKNKEDYVKSEDEFEILPDVEKWLKLLKENEFKLIVVTNQSMIGRKISTMEKLNAIHQKMQNFFKKEGFQIDKIYCCPHTPEDNCRCRKPGIKFFQDAIEKFCIDVANSWVIGDKDSDILAGKRVGCKTIKIKTNSALKEPVIKILNDVDD